MNDTHDEHDETLPAWKQWPRVAEVIGVGLVWLVAGLIIWAASGCKAGNAAWNVQNGQMSTQFEVSWGTSVKIGFPGMLHGDAKGAGELKGEPVPVTPSEPVPVVTP